MLKAVSWTAMEARGRLQAVDWEQIADLVEAWVWGRAQVVARVGQESAARQALIPLVADCSLCISWNAFLPL